MRYSAAILVAIVLALTWVLIRKSRNAQSKINLEDLILGEDGTVSRAAFVMLGSFILTSWVVIELTMTEKLTEGYFTAYCGVWVIPAVTKLIKGTTASVSSTTVSSTTVTPTS